MNRPHLLGLAGVLALVGLLLFAYKALIVQLPLYAGQRTDVWRVETEIHFTAKGGPTKVTVQLPSATGRLQVVDQSFVSPGYGLTIAPGTAVNQRATFSIASASGAQVIYSRFVMSRIATQDSKSRDPRPEVQRPDLSTPAAVAAEEIVRAERQRAADPGSLAALVAQRLRNAEPGSEADFLVGRNPTVARVVAMTVDLLALADVPARAVHGISLELERSNAEFVHWLEVFQEGRWVPVYVGEKRPEVIRHYLPWWRGRSAFATVEGGSDLAHRITVSRSQELALQTAMHQQRATERRLVELSLFGLPLQTQLLFRSLVVIPVGIFLLVVLRNVVGLKTFGTFMPVLIALAFRQTGLVWGIALFAIIVAIGLSARFYMERLKLLLVPRLAVGVMVVVLIICVLTVLLHRLGLMQGLSLGLFPIVILTMTIERMSIVWEENGPREALQQAAGSLVVGVLTFLVMKLPQLEHLLFVFPELLLVVLAATLLLGRYSGYRLTELRRFRALSR